MSRWRQMGIEGAAQGLLNDLKVVAKSLVWISAFLLSAGLAASQLLLGGWWYPALAAPGYLLVGGSAVVAGLVFWKTESAPGAFCTGVAVVFAGYLFWRQFEAPDPYAARENTWLLLGALAVYGVAAWQLRDNGARWLVLGTLFTLSTLQVVVAVAQFVADAPFHPLADLALHMKLPRGDGSVANHGWVSGTLESRGTLSAVLQATTFLALGMLVWGRTAVAAKLVLLWVAAAGFAGLALCMSRAAYFGVPAGVVVFALVSFFVVQRGALAYRAWLGAGALGLVALALGLAFAIGLESVSVQLRITEVGSDDYREKLWFSVVPPMLALDPWLGAGANMFDQLATRYGGPGPAGRAVHAHNDWLQLLVEYGRAGLLLGAAFFVVHFAAGWRNSMRLAREMPPAGLLPQGNELGLSTGALAALCALAVHAFFDYRMHLPSVVLLAALCAGWLSSARHDPAAEAGVPVAWWLKAAAFVLTLAPGSVLVCSVLRQAPAEWLALRAENAVMSGEPRAAWNLAQEGLALRPDNPRLLVLAGESAGLLGNAATTPPERADWFGRSADYFGEATRNRPLFAYAWRERALALDWCGKPISALPVHLHAITRAPEGAHAYEYLALHYWKQGRFEEASRLFRLSKGMPGSRLAGEFLRQIEQSQSQSSQTR